MTQAEAPLVSIFNFCMNRKAMIARSIESVLGQSYKNIELVIQDGASTDGTLEIIRSYERKDSRIKLVSEPDSGPIEAFIKVIRRCEGEIIGSCLSDEELLPGAIEKVAGLMRGRPELGAVTADGDIINELGEVTGPFIAGEFDYVAYLFGRYCPLWAASFFRRSALGEVGIYEPDWNPLGVEFEVWSGLATRYEVQYLPERLAKYAMHGAQLSNAPRNIIEHVDFRLGQINKLFSEGGFFGRNEPLRVACIAAQLAQFADHAYVTGLDEVLGALEDRRKQELGNAASQALANVGYAGIHRIQSRTQRNWHKLATLMPLAMRRHIPRNLKNRIRQTFKDTLTDLRVRMQAARTNGGGDQRTWENRIDASIGKDPQGYRWIYPQLAELFEARGQIAQSIACYLRAEPLEDEGVDTAICQATLKLPEATEATVAAAQARWADRHVDRTESRPAACFRPFDGRRKIRIGYHCAFMETSTIRAQMMSVMAAHPRASFEVYGYSGGPVHGDLEAVFDRFLNTAHLDDAAFADKVREDEIDVFVEMTGFSPHHRFGAMAKRVAPVQISYLNHAGTSGIPEVDYVIADETGIPAGSAMERHYAEAVHRIPGCFFVFDYERLGAPPVADPPAPRFTRRYSARSSLRPDRTFRGHEPHSPAAPRPRCARWDPDRRRRDSRGG